MSLALTVTFTLANWIVKGLADGTLTRVGGVVVDASTKQVVTWLRDVTNNSPVPKPSGSPNNLLNLIVSGANLVTSGANTVVTTKGFADVNGV